MNGLDLTAFINDNTYLVPAYNVYRFFRILNLMSKFVDTNEWQPVHTLPGFECAIEYHVNRNGDLKSTKGGREKILKRITLKNGYQKYTLQQRLGQKAEKQAYAHTLVALAFLDPSPTPLGRTKGCSCVIHCDGDRSNNHFTNLKWAFIDGNRD